MASDGLWIINFYDKLKCDVAFADWRFNEPLIYRFLLGHVIIDKKRFLKLFSHMIVALSPHSMMQTSVEQYRTQRSQPILSTHLTSSYLS